MSGKHTADDNGEKCARGQLTFEHPSVADGAPIWRIVRDSGKLDLNSSYAYLLWCRDFADTSLVAREDDKVVGFVLGYHRREVEATAVVWQVAVDSSQRGRGLAGQLLDELFSRLTAVETRYLETSITPDNAASIALFSSFAKRWSAEMAESQLFAASDFPDEHEPERLYRIGPLQAGG
jgi:L-2,4-diaminobutyric acid acetyltransferase